MNEVKFASLKVNFTKKKDVTVQSTIVFLSAIGWFS